MILFMRSLDLGLDRALQSHEMYLKDALILLYFGAGGRPRSVEHCGRPSQHLCDGGCVCVCFGFLLILIEFHIFSIDFY